MAQSQSSGRARPSNNRSASTRRSASRSGGGTSDGSGSRARGSGSRRASARKSSSSNNRGTAGKASSRSRSSAARRADGRGRVETVKQSLASGAQSTREGLTSGAKAAGGAVGGAAKKAKGPALAGSAALVGMAGGLAIAGRARRRRVLGVPLPGTRRPLVKLTAPRRTKVRGKKLIKAAGEAGSAGRQAAELAGALRLVRQQLDANRRRSPIEVVLDGLTARRSRD